MKRFFEFNHEISGGRGFCHFMFWVWGLFYGGFALLNVLALETQSIPVGVGTSTYITMRLLTWIGGMLLFGLGALITPPKTKMYMSEEPLAQMRPDHRAYPGSRSAPRSPVQRERA